MPSFLALLCWFLLLLALLWLDPAKASGTSLALWVPLIWIFIVGSRLPAQWLGGQMVMAGHALEEGNPVDRTVFSILILLAVGILILRSFHWGDFLICNFILIAFLSFALASALWSDFPFVSFKRWFRDLGNYLVILVVLSDPRPLEAVRTLLRRLCYLLIPLSILLIKYYPNLAKAYSVYTGAAEFVGAATSKNMLGAMCLISGIFFFWDTVTRWPDRKEWRTKRILVVNVVFIGMTLWLLNLSNSATCRVCLVIASLVIVGAHSGWAGRHPHFLKVSIPAIFCLYLVLAFGFDLNGQLASQVGRDPTLTDRTLIWKAVLSLQTNPLVGTGYESFWLGSRFERVGQVVGHINEAHNGYLEIYLNLGAIGLFLIGGLLVTSYRDICKKLSSSSTLASLSLAMWTVMVFYNVTEAGFRGGLLWLIFLLSAIAIPERNKDRVHRVAAVNNLNAKRRVPKVPLEVASSRR